MFVSVQDKYVLDSVSVDESHCYNNMSALPSDVIAHHIANPSYMQFDSSCSITARFLKCAQFNVQTLAQFSTRKSLLAHFINQQFSIGCFQETRSKTGRSRCIENVVMNVSASDNGNYGCEVWVNLTAPMFLKDGRKVYLTRDCITKVFGDPRIVIVRCRALKVDFYVISAHAPYVRGKNGKQACDWWASLSSIVAEHCTAGIPVLAGIDGNYVVHNDPSVGVADVCRFNF